MIKPCPKCGSTPDVIDEITTMICCPKCQDDYRILAGFDKNKLIELWNEKADEDEKLTKEQLLENWENGYFK